MANTFKNNLDNETLASTGRAVLETTATTASLAVLAAKTLAAAWHTTELGNAARNQDLASTARLEGETKDYFVGVLDTARSYLTTDETKEAAKTKAKTALARKKAAATKA